MVIYLGDEKPLKEEALDLKKARILIVEDQAIVAKDIANTLEDLGYQVVAAVDNGSLAIKVAREEQVDLVLMDIVLKGEINGIQASEEILDMDIPVIYLTAYSDEETLRKAKITRPYGYLIKPFDKREIQINIEIALYEHRMKKLLEESQKRFKTLVESSPDTILLVDRREKKVKYANGNVFFDRRIDEMVDFPPPENMIHPEDRVEVMEVWDKGLKDASPSLSPTPPMDFRFRSTKNDWKWLRSRMVVLDNEKSDEMLVIISDVDQEKKAQRQALKQKNLETKLEVTRILMNLVPSLISSRERPVNSHEFYTELASQLDDVFFDEYFAQIDTPEDYARWITKLFTDLGAEMDSEVVGDVIQLHVSKCPWSNDIFKNPLLCTISRGIIERAAVKSLGECSLVQEKSMLAGDDICSFCIRK